MSNWWGFVGSETKIDKSNTIGWTWGDILFVIVTAWMWIPVAIFYKFTDLFLRK